VELRSAGDEESPPAVVLGGVRLRVDIEGRIAIRVADAAGHLDNGRLRLCLRRREEKSQWLRHCYLFTRSLPKRPRISSYPLVLFINSHSCRRHSCLSIFHFLLLFSCETFSCSFRNSSSCFPNGLFAFACQNSARAKILFEFCRLFDTTSISLTWNLQFDRKTYLNTWTLANCATYIISSHALHNPNVIKFWSAERWKLRKLRKFRITKTSTMNDNYGKCI